MVLSRLLSPLALLLALVVGGQVTDLLPCADEGCSAWHALTETHEGGDHEKHGDEHGHAPDEGAASDCLCHLAFSAAPRVSAPTTPETRAAFPPQRPAAPPSAAQRVPYPPPRA